MWSESLNLFNPAEEARKEAERLEKEKNFKPMYLNETKGVIRLSLIVGAVCGFGMGMSLMYILIK